MSPLTSLSSSEWGSAFDLVYERQLTPPFWYLELIFRLLKDLVQTSHIKVSWKYLTLLREIATEYNANKTTK